MSRISSIVTAALFFVLLYSANGAAYVVNGGFESNLDGWNSSLNVSVMGGWAGVLPTEGDFEAVMSPLGIMPSTLSQSLESESSFSLSFDYNIWSFGLGKNGAGDDFVVSLKGDGYVNEILRVNAKDSVSNGQGWKHWNGAGDDSVASLNGNGHVNKILRGNSKDGVSHGATIQGWEHFEETYEFDSPMALSLYFDLDNYKDLSQLSIAFIDNVTVSAIPTPPPVPLPPAFILLGSALVGLAGKRVLGRGALPVC